MRMGKQLYAILVLVILLSSLNCFDEKPRKITYEIYKNDVPLKNEQFEVVHREPQTGHESSHGLFQTNENGKLSKKQNIPAGISIYLRYKGKRIYNSSIYIYAKKVNYQKRIDLPPKFTF